MSESTRYEPKTIEPRWQKYWQDLGLYRFQETSNKPVYSIDTPPPTVSGRLHIGHVFSYTHTEITSRYHRMTGHNVYYPFGYDDNGLPTEILTERETGVKAYQADRQKFREMCLETGKKYAELFSSLWQKLGFSCDFGAAYSTISRESQKISQWSFIDLFHKGFLERRNEPALWCTNCVTSFAQAEIDDVNKAGKYLHLPFNVPGMEPIVIATTRPELLAACACLFVHPDDKRFLAYHGKKAKVPFYDHEVPVLLDSKAQMDKGTGAVMCCTFGDTTDIAWWRQHKLPLREAISKIGKMTEITGPLAGLRVEAAKKEMEKVLTEKGLVLKTVDIPAETRVVNTHERCGTPVEFLVQPQWFVQVVKHKEKLIEMGRKIKWHPEFMRHRYENWVENLSWDWAISRQRSFGVPIPAWYTEDGEVYVPETTDLPVDPTLHKPKRSSKSGAPWIGDADVLDTWATSSVTPLLNARHGAENERPNFLPMSMRPQAHDIIRTWAFYTIAKSYFHFGEVPWKEIVVSGHVKKPGQQVEAAQMAGQEFAKKTKISKSKDGDTYAPEKMMERHPSDAIPLWSAAASIGLDVPFDENGMNDASKFLNKFWNASRFALMNLESFVPKFLNEKFESRNANDLQVLGRLKKIVKAYHENFQSYELHKAKIELDKFFWDVCDDYIELVKYRCLKEYTNSEDKSDAQNSLYRVIFGLLQLYAPYAPHITEEIYQMYFKQFEKAESIHLIDLPKTAELSTAENSAMEAWMNGGGKLSLAAVRRIKKDNAISYRTPLKVLTLVGKGPIKNENLKLFTADLAGFAFAEMVELKSAIAAGAQPQTGNKIFRLETDDLDIQVEVSEEAMVKKLN